MAGDGSLGQLHPDGVVVVINLKSAVLQMLYAALNFSHVLVDAVAFEQAASPAFFQHHHVGIDGGKDSKTGAAHHLPEHHGIQGPPLILGCHKSSHGSAGLGEGALENKIGDDDADEGNQR